MARKRTQYKITGKFTINDKDVNGLIVIDLGPCFQSGELPTKTRKLLANAPKLHKFKFAEWRALKALGLSKTMLEFTMLEDHMGMFLTKQTEDE